MQAETVIRLSTVPNIIGIKEATGDLKRAKPSSTASARTSSCCPAMIHRRRADPAGRQGQHSVTANVARAKWPTCARPR
jgi:dihydrodipicolinate synthase/N-acetylneuraminate lyase